MAKSRTTITSAPVAAGPAASAGTATIEAPINLAALKSPPNLKPDVEVSTALPPLTGEDLRIFDSANRIHAILLDAKLDPEVWGEITVTQQSFDKARVIMGALACCRQLCGMQDRIAEFPYNTINQLLGAVHKFERHIPNTIGAVPQNELASDKTKRDKLDKLHNLSGQGEVNVRNLIDREEREGIEEQENEPTEALTAPVAELAVTLHDSIMNARRSDAWITGKIGLGHENRQMIHGALALLRQLLKKTDRTVHFPYNTVDELVAAVDTSTKARSALGIPRAKKKAQTVHVG